jgi:type II secretory pathway pseudopilin PulG
MIRVIVRVLVLVVAVAVVVLVLKARARISALLQAAAAAAAAAAAIMKVKVGAHQARLYQAQLQKKTAIATTRSTPQKCDYGRVPFPLVLACVHGP